MTISRIFIFSTLLAAVLVSTSAFADAPRWRLDPAKSKLGFSGEQTGKKFEGRFARYTTDIAFDPDHPDISHIAVTVDLASASTGDTQRDTAMPGKDWFDTAEFPQAKFETTQIRKTDSKGYEATGNLTLRGLTKSVTLPFTFQLDGATAHAVGHLSLIRSEFGVGQGAWATGQWVALDVGVDVDIVATREN